MNAWKRELERSRDCIAIDRFAGTLTTVERDHLAHCARCEAEIALWQQFEANEPSADEGGAVQWVAAEARRRLKAAAADRKASGWREWIGSLRPRTMAVAAALLAAAGIAYGTWERGVPAITSSYSGAPIYRSGSVQLIAPSGDVAAPPVELRWGQASGAARYDVELREVDGTVIWRTSVAGTQVPLPAGVAAQFAPGRTLLWHVTAKTSSGGVLAESETGRFRVPVHASQRKQ